MTIYSLNTTFPDANPAPGADFAIIRLMEGGTFDLVMYMTNPSEKEIQAVQTGKMQYGVFINKYIPFFLAKFETFTFDASINMMKAGEDSKRDKWINSDANLVSFFLIDSNTNTLKAMRIIGIEPAAMNDIKTMLRQQPIKFMHSGGVENAITEITNRFTTDDMIVKSKMYTP